MKTIKNSFLALCTTVLLVACGGSTSNHSTDAKGFAAIEQDLKDKFGEDAYYTDLNISHDNNIGNMISLTVTDAPESLKMGQYVYSNHTDWKQNSEVTLELPEGTQAKDFMFQINDNINLKKLGELVETSKEKLTADKNIDNPHMEMAYISFPKNGDITKAQYVVKLEPENGGTDFTYFYKLNGEFVEMDY